MTINHDTIRVKTLRQHLNDAGEHIVDDEYEINRIHGERLIARGFVALAVAEPKARTAPENKRRSKAPTTKA